MPHRKFLHRIRAEFMEMPGLQLNLAQAQRLYGLDRTTCKAALDALVEEHFLRVKDGKYRRVSPEHSAHSHVQTGKDADEHESIGETLRARRPRRGVAR